MDSARPSLKPATGSVSASLKILVQNECGAVALLGQHLLSVGVTRLELPQVHIIQEGVRALSENGKVFTFLAYREPGSELIPESAARAKMEKLTKEYCGSLAAVALVYPGSGFGATIFRSVVTAMTIASAASFPNRVFSSVGGAAQWLSATLPAELRAPQQQLVECIGAMRSLCVADRAMTKSGSRK